MSGSRIPVRFTSCRTEERKLSGVNYSHWYSSQDAVCTPFCPLLLNLDPPHLQLASRLVSIVYLVQFSSVQSLSRVRFSATPWTAARQASLSLTNSWSFTQTHVYWVSETVLPSHPLMSPYPPAFNLSQHQGLFHWVSSLHQVAKVLEFQLQDQSFQWTPRTDFL